MHRDKSAGAQKHSAADPPVRALSRRGASLGVAITVDEIASEGVHTLPKPRERSTVEATIEATVERLTVHGLLYRLPRETLVIRFTNQVGIVFPRCLNMSQAKH